MQNQEFDKTVAEKIAQWLSEVGFTDADLTVEQEKALKALFYCSDFCTQLCFKYPQVAKSLLMTEGAVVSKFRDTYCLQLTERVVGIELFDDLSREIRQFRYEETLRIAWNDLVEKVAVEQTLRELSWLADACIESSVNKLMQWAVIKHGQPVDEANEPVHLVVLAMGKLGADELNFSSDIDLIYCFQHDGMIKKDGKELSHSEFFIRLCQKLTGLLSENTAYGFVYRVDTRLRPFGDSGQLALSFDALENYYERHGREWERYAMVKARPISQDGAAAENISKILKPFVYRRYLDFSAFSSLREMKQLIDKEISRKGANKDVKLGPGGIREIEFIGQAFQLIRGGRTVALQQRSILAILSQLNDMNLIESSVHKELQQAYRFLRKTENTLQAYAEQQTHVLPNDELQQQRLAYALDCESWESFYNELEKHTQIVQGHFENIFSVPQFKGLAGGEVSQFSELWSGSMDSETSISLLLDAGYKTPEEAFNRIQHLKESSKYKAMGPNGKQRFDKLMPLLIPMVAKCDHADVCLLRIIRLLEAIARRTAYIALLSEHPAGLQQLITLFDKSAWVADLLVTHPILMDELIDPRRLYEPMYQEDLVLELAYGVNLESEDIERQIHRLIDFKQSNFLRVAASELMNVMPVEQVSDHLTYIAEATVDAVKVLAENDLSRKNGFPTYMLDGNKQEAEFCVIAYGKLGGMELGFGSDLDLVFLHDSQGTEQITNGDKSLDNAVFYARLGQRIMRFLSTPTQSGKLYEVDMRLRPSGGAGVLVSSLKSFFEYQKNKAWRWEHQALVRARCVCGSDALKQRFREIRKAVLCQTRDEVTLLKDVCDMRQRMRKELLKKKSAVFDLKQGDGGMTDIEFIIQYLVLRWANKYPAIVEFTDNIRLLEALVNASVLNDEDAKVLKNAYLTYRHTVHQNVLKGRSGAIVDELSFVDCRDGVSRIWSRIMQSE